MGAEQSLGCAPGDNVGCCETRDGGTTSAKDSGWLGGGVLGSTPVQRTGTAYSSVSLCGLNQQHTGIDPRISPGQRQQPATPRTPRTPETPEASPGTPVSQQASTPRSVSSTPKSLSLGSMKGHLTDLNKRVNVQLMKQKGDDDETEESFNEARKPSRKPSQAEAGAEPLSNRELAKQIGSPRGSRPILAPHPNP